MLRNRLLPAVRGVAMSPKIRAAEALDVVVAAAAEGKASLPLRLEAGSAPSGTEPDMGVEGNEKVPTPPPVVEFEAGANEKPLPPPVVELDAVEAPNKLAPRVLEAEVEEPNEKPAVSELEVAVAPNKLAPPPVLDVEEEEPNKFPPLGDGGAPNTLPLVLVVEGRPKMLPPGRALEVVEAPNKLAPPPVLDVEEEEEPNMFPLLPLDPNKPPPPPVLELKRNPGLPLTLEEMETLREPAR